MQTVILHSGRRKKVGLPPPPMIFCLLVNSVISVLSVIYVDSNNTPAHYDFATSFGII